MKEKQVLWQGSGLALRRQVIEDEIERLEIVLNGLHHTQFRRMRDIVEQIEALRAELDAMDDLMAVRARGLIQEHDDAQKRL